MVKDLMADLTFVKSKLKVDDKIFTDEDTIEGPSIASVPKEGPSIASVPKEGPSIASVPKEGPSIASVPKEWSSQEFLKWYGYDTVKEYLEDTFMDTTDKDIAYKDTTDKDTIDKVTTDKDSIDEVTIDESYFPKSKDPFDSGWIMELIPILNRLISLLK
nr:hypothetical protein [Tanacetum cinerariifolium]